jgi:hypothetical protein
MKIDLSQIASDKPVITILTIVAATVAIIVGGVVTITNPQSLSFHQYIQDITFMAGALGLGSGIGRGIDSYGGKVAEAQRAPAPTVTPLPPPTPLPTPDPAPDDQPVYGDEP